MSGLIEVTPEMIEAGVRQAWLFGVLQGEQEEGVIREMVVAIFREMAELAKYE